VKVRCVVLAILFSGGMAQADGGRLAWMEGRDLFVHDQKPGDRRAAEGGDGLGPMCNETSCTSCLRSLEAPRSATGLCALE